MVVRYRRCCGMGHGPLPGWTLSRPAQHNGGAGLRCLCANLRLSCQLFFVAQFKTVEYDCRASCEVYSVNRVAIVTGGTRGIGRGIVMRLADRGVRVATTYHRDESAADALRQHFANGRGDCVVDKLDVAQLDSIPPFVERVLTRYGRIDYLVNNVGNDCSSPIVDASIEDWLSTANLILNAPFVFSKYVLPAMRRQSFGRIVNIGASSKNYLSGNANLAPSSIFKGALILFTKTLALEEIRNGITANVVGPGSTKDAGTLAEDERIPISAIPIGRRVTIDEVTDAVCYFLDERSGAVTGQVLNVNGGLSV